MVLSARQDTRGGLLLEPSAVGELICRGFVQLMVCTVCGAVDDGLR